MTLLDDLTSFATLDRSQMIAHIEGLPQQLGTAWRLGNEQPLPSWEGLRQVIIAGMGGSAIGGDLLAAYAAERCPLPIVVHRDYHLPAWAQGPSCLVIASSHSGNTEETLSSFEVALERGCRILALTTGGELARRAHQAGVPLWQFTHEGQPRAAVGYSFGLLLAALARLNLLPEPSAEVESAIQAMEEQQESLRPEQPTVHNPAKRLAGQLIGRWVVVFGSDLLAPVARRWKGQINELAKAWAQFEFLPEADHNTLAGLVNPPSLLPQVAALFLFSPSDNPRNRLRSDLTRQALMLEGLSTDFVEARGDTPLAHQWTLLHFGDYVAYYLAMAYSVDPTPVPAIEGFKKALQERG